MESKDYSRLARALGSTPVSLQALEKKMAGLTGKEGTLYSLDQENQEAVRRMKNILGLTETENSFSKVYAVLMDRLRVADQELFSFLGKPDLSTMAQACGQLCQVVSDLHPSGNGFFIKKDKAVALLEQYPPQNILDFFGYTSVAELIAREDLSAVFSALRFVQDQAWMHRFFNEAYGQLRADDFEARPVEVKILETKWLKMAENFLQKKYHNVSHLKELGVIFVIPLPIDTPGETLRMFTLLLHYLNEVPFYSRLFRRFSSQPDFAEKLKSLLRGDVPERAPKEQEGEIEIRIIQRYLAKDDSQDLRLSEPHLNPEVEHWHNEGIDFSKLDHIFGQKSDLFGLWQKLDFVGDFLIDDRGQSSQLSFNLIDLIMTLVYQGKKILTYHRQEALWNEIFVRYWGREKLDQLVEDNIIDGFIRWP